MKSQSQGRQLIAHLKRKPHTAMELLSYGISVCPWKRVTESLLPEEELVKAKRHLGGSRYATTWLVVKATKWTA